MELVPWHEIIGGPEIFIHKDIKIDITMSQSSLAFYSYLTYFESFHLFSRPPLLGQLEGCKGSFGSIFHMFVNIFRKLGKQRGYYENMGIKIRIHYRPNRNWCKFASSFRPCIPPISCRRRASSWFPFTKMVHHPINYSSKQGYI